MQPLQKGCGKDAVHCRLAGMETLGPSAAGIELAYTSSLRPGNTQGVGELLRIKAHDLACCGSSAKHTAGAGEMPAGKIGGTAKSFAGTNGDIGTYDIGKQSFCAGVAVFFSEGKNSAEQVKMCFAAAGDENWRVVFD